MFPQFVVENIYFSGLLMFASLYFSDAYLKEKVFLKLFGDGPLFYLRQSRLHEMPPSPDFM